MTNAIPTAKIGAYAVAIIPITNRTKRPKPNAIKNHLPYMSFATYPRVR